MAAPDRMDGWLAERDELDDRGGDKVAHDLLHGGAPGSRVTVDQDGSLPAPPG